MVIHKERYVHQLTEELGLWQRQLAYHKHEANWCQTRIDTLTDSIKLAKENLG